MPYHRGAGTLLLAAAIVSRTNAQLPSGRGAATVPTIENLRPTWAPSQQMRLGSAPILVLGTRSEPVYQFSRVAGAVLLRDHRIVVADGGSSELRFYDPTGKYLTSRGRRGEGPGEFRGLSTLQRADGDSLFAGSGSLLSLFTSDGTFVRRVDPFQPPAPLPPGERFVLGAFDGGKSVMAAMPRPVESNHLPRDGFRWTDSMHLAIVGLDNALIANLGRFPSRVMEWRGTDLRLPWFAPQVRVTGNGKQFFLGFGSEYEVRVFSATGRLDRIIRRTWVPERVDVNAWVGARVAAAVDGDRAALRTELTSAPRAETLPAFEVLLVDQTGKLWVRDSRVSDYLPQEGKNPSPSNWSVFGRDGKWLGNVRTPPRFRPTDIGADYVLGIARDAEDVETVVLYKLGLGG